jgi:tetratricopeptide (TPR) repeat protein
MLNKLCVNSKKQKLIVYIVLALVTLAVFWQVHQFDFVNFDDNIYVTQNSHIQSGITLDGLRWAFSTTYAEFWHPLTWLSLIFDHQFYGLNPFGYHLTNLILHILSTLLLFWLFNRMTGTIWKSAFVAALFALHPLRVESVAWIAERKDVLSVFFWMLTLCLYVYYTEKPVIKRYLLVVFCFACGLMSKSMVITLPLVMILLDYWPIGRFQSRENNLMLWQLREKIPFFVFSAVFAIITLCTQQSVKHAPLNSRLANAPVSFATYLAKTFWPHNLAVFYPFSEQLPIWQILGSVLLILVISAAVIAVARRLPYLFVGWLWYTITILPVIGIVPVGNFAMADRFTYLPSIGIAIMLAWGIPLLFRNKDMRKNILFPAAVVFLIILSVLTWEQCSYWKNSVTLFSHALRVTKDNAPAHNNLGLALFAEGKSEEAIYHYNEAIRITPITPHHFMAYNNRGLAYNKLGQHQMAIEDFNEAIHLKQDYAEAYNNRGTIYQKLGQYQRAIEDFSEAIRLKPDDSSGYFNRGNTYINLGRYQQAIEDFNNAIRLDPASSDAYNNRAFIYIKLGRYQQALEDYSKAILLKSDYADAYNNRALVYINLGNKDLGCADARKACALGVCKTLEVAGVKGLCH